MMAVAVVVATILAERYGPVDSQVLVGMGALAGASLLARRWRSAGAVAAVPGSWLVVTGADPAVGSLGRASAVLAVLAIGAGVADLDRRWSPGRRRPSPACALVAGWGCAVLLAVPDTEQAIPVAGVLASAGALSLVLAFVGWPGGSRVGALASWPAAGLLVWLALVGGMGRDGAVAGAVAGAGSLIAEPLAYRVAGRTGKVAASPLATVTIVVLHAEAAFIAARVVAQPRALSAATVMGGILIGALVLVIAAASPWTSLDPGGRPSTRSRVGSGS